MVLNCSVTKSGKNLPLRFLLLQQIGKLIAFPPSKFMKFTNISSLTSSPKSTKEEEFKPKLVNKSEKDKFINLSSKLAYTYT